jgi:hypothetical protein
MQPSETSTTAHVVRKLLTAVVAFWTTIPNRPSIITLFGCFQCLDFRIKDPPLYNIWGMKWNSISSCSTQVSLGTATTHPAIWCSQIGSIFEHSILGTRSISHIFTKKLSFQMIHWQHKEITQFSELSCLFTFELKQLLNISVKQVQDSLTNIITKHMDDNVMWRWRIYGHITQMQPGSRV